MTLGFGIKIVLEVVAVMLIAYGILNEEKLIAFEDELFPVLKFCFKKYVLRQNMKQTRTKKPAPAPVHRAEIKVLPSRKTDVRSHQNVA